MIFFLVSKINEVQPVIRKSKARIFDSFSSVTTTKEAIFQSLLVVFPLLVNGYAPGTSTDKGAS